MAEDMNRTQVEEEENILTIEYDDGSSVDCEIMGVFDYDGKDYIALIPLDESDDVYIYAYQQYSDDTFDITDIESEELFNKVAAELDEIMASIDDSEDEE